ncbi:hypothetical protein LMH87_005481 [Akanthomyces muscarius]|uniref:Uncharacterized protein n=1 Tax=Akanthomyces muscarius TaxID=2231603 RepID=A0A9W8QKS6_AKAMU|nr:hypothetical protein LMH87_005481 [Akanthomyces muscarius]KAJ4163773.1 hypothetical protein LMH87_005481 [Akanthomyces muscarius]
MSNVSSVCHLVGLRCYPTPDLNANSSSVSSPSVVPPNLDALRLGHAPSPCRLLSLSHSFAPGAGTARTAV